MPEISLRDYEFEIDQLIEEARYLEAFAHLRHIIRKYPHYIGAYYLMGKMLLEADQPELAADMFRRALNADPEHLKSRIGLGLTHEQRDDLDAAIWNLERAFELAPANADIAEELRRIYGRRDGKDPNHIPISRAGLSRLYMRGNLSSRAVDELRNLLTTEPSRPDLQGALAEAYWRDGQIVQAAETCQRILDDMPYNRKANLLLGTLWVNSGQEEGQIYLKRSQEVDVENVLAVELLGSASPLKQHEVIMERLVYDLDTIDVDQQAEWFKRLEAASVSIGISEAVPDMSESDVRLVDITAGLESQIEIPDWLRELGSLDDGTDQDGGLAWMSDMILGEELEGKDTAIEVVEPPAVEIEVPEIVSSGAFDSPDVEAHSESVEESAGWLSELVAEEFDETAEEVPDWLEEITPKSSDIFETEQPVEAFVDSAVQVGQDEIGWDQTETPEPEIASPEEILAAEYADEMAETPEWLQTIVPPSMEETAEEPGAVLEDIVIMSNRLDEVANLVDDTEVPLVDEEQAQPDEIEKIAELTLTEASFEEDAAEVPDWLQAIAPTATEATVVEQTDVSETSSAPQDWLDEIVAEMEDEEVMQPESEIPPEEPSDGVPDWLQALAPATAEATVMEPIGEGREERAELDWLEEITADIDTGSPQPVSEIPPEEPSDGVPDWLKALAPATAKATVMEPISEDREASAELDWLEEIAADKDTDEGLQLESESTIADDSLMEAPDAVNDIPDWISQLQPTSKESEEFVLSEEELPEWLAEFNNGATDTPIQPTPDRIEELDETEGWTEAPTPLATDLQGPPVGELESVESIQTTEEKSEGMFGWDAFGETITEATPTSDTSISIKEEAPEGDMLSGDDALVWLESLTFGKEEELRAQAKVDSEARIAEILGRRTTPDQAEPVEEAVVETVSELEPAPEATVIQEPVVETAEPEMEVIKESMAEVAEAELFAEAVLTAPEAEGDLMSGDDALAWLESLTIGKEEELRAQAEVDSEARIAEILGRRTTPDRAEPVEEAVVETVIELEPELEATVIQETVVEAAEPEMEVIKEPMAEVAEAELFAEAVPTAPEAEGDLMSGDDALAWLESLTIGKEEELRAQAEVDSEARIAEILGRRTTPDRVEPVEEAVVETVSELEPELEATVIQETVAEAAEPELLAEVPAVSEPEPEPEMEVIEEAMAEVAEQLEETAQDSELDELEEMRNHLKRKRSDHNTRLTFSRALWAAGDIKEAMKNYGLMIKSGAKMDEIHHDLQEYLETHPKDSDVLRTLGDAYMKDGALERALEIYNEAMSTL